MRKIGIIIAGLVVALIMLGLGACAKAEQPEVNSADSKQGKVYKIGISQIDEHEALDDSRRGFEQRLAELGLEVEIIYKNAQGEIPIAASISSDFVKQELDLIYAIATPSAQVAKQEVDRSGAEIPIVFGAVSDPVASGLIESMAKPGGNITGVSDQGPVSDQLDLLGEIKPEAKTIGVIYSTKESNSEAQIAELKKACEPRGYSLELVGISDVSEIAPGMDVLLAKVDAMFIIADNTVAKSIGLVASKMIEAQMVSICADESTMHGGGLITKGSSYYKMGQQAADMAYEILTQGVAAGEIPAALAKKLSVSYNAETAEALGLDMSKYDH